MVFLPSNVYPVKRRFIILVIFLYSVSAAAQSDSTKVLFKLSMNYNSNLNYYGRTDSMRSSGIFPLAEIWTPSGWYLNAAPIFVNNKIQRFEYAGTVATVGYQKVSESWIHHAYLIKPFYTQEAQLVQSALKVQTGFTLSHLNQIANITAGADLKFSDKIDLGTTLGIDRIFFIQPEKMNLLINPSVYLYAGSQQFSKTYTTKKSRGLLLPPTTTENTKSFSQFNVLAYELSVPVIYTKNSLQLSATPAFVMPQNLMVVEGRPDLSEQGKNTLYLTLGAKYSF